MALVPSEKENEGHQIKLMQSLIYSSNQAHDISEKKSDFRKFLDQKQEERKLALNLKPTIVKPTSQRTKEHANNSARIICRDFDSWREVPDQFKTRNQWLRAGRKVQDDETAKGRVLYPRFVELGGPVSLWDNCVLDHCDDLILVTDPPTSLFHVDQTVPYNASSRTIAYQSFEDFFFQHSRKDSYGRKSDPQTGEELDGWFTVTAALNAQRFHDRQFLTSQLIRQHINQKHIVGVKATRLTRFFLIDLDYHGRDLQVFERQAEVLLDAFHGKGTWHYQVKRQDVTGLQLICVFDEPKDLEVITEKAQTILRELDRQNPELVIAAKKAGMKTLADLELYPDSNQAVRLPLCRDREMLLDKPLSLVTHRKQQVQDVEGYVHWLEDPNREYMLKERILDYLHYFAFHSTQSSTKSTKPKVKGDSGNGEITASGWYGNLKRWLFQFWIEGNANGRSLNEHIAVLSRLAACFGHGEVEIVKKITAFIGELPACAKSSSSRLLQGKLKKIDRVIETTAKYVCDENGHQDDPAFSTKKLQKVLAKWTGFNPLDKSTWKVLGLKIRSKSNVTPNWTEQQKQDLCGYLRKPLFVKNDELILSFVNGIVNLTIDKEREGNGWHKEYLLK